MILMLMASGCLGLIRLIVSICTVGRGTLTSTCVEVEVRPAVAEALVVSAIDFDPPVLANGSLASVCCFCFFFFLGGGGVIFALKGFKAPIPTP